MNLCNINDIKALLGRHGFHFSKSMGQNFLIEDWVPQQIAESSGADAEHGVMEIGPGIGPLTSQLARRAGKVVAVELDRSLLPILDETMSSYDNVTIVPGDVMKLNLMDFAEEHFSGMPAMVCANLPYNITTPVLTALIESHRFDAITVMIQREVALRICAAPGTSDYGAVSIYCQYYTDPSLLFDVPPECFLPAPKVTSAVIRMVPRSAPPVEVCNEALFFRLVKAAFAQRRKTLLNALSAGFGSQIPKEELRLILEECALPADVRGERLGIQDFSNLTADVQARLS